LVALLGAVYYFVIPTTLNNPIVLNNQQYRFKVFCPYNRIPPERRKVMDENGTVHFEDDLRFLTQDKDEKDSVIDQYVITMQMHPHPLNNSQYMFQYCSWVTDWDKKDNCEEAEHVCSVPGPIFYVERNKPIEVAWVYELENEKANPLFANSGCYDISQNDDDAVSEHCSINRKLPGYENCTYPGPTNHVLFKNETQPV
jgi:hypothetical protein